jgi:hypothetical protein
MRIRFGLLLVIGGDCRNLSCSAQAVMTCANESGQEAPATQSMLDGGRRTANTAQCLRGGQVHSWRTAWRPSSATIRAEDAAVSSNRNDRLRHRLMPPREHKSRIRR